MAADGKDNVIAFNPPEAQEGPVDQPASSPPPPTIIPSVPKVAEAARHLMIAYTTLRYECGLPPDLAADLAKALFQSEAVVARIFN